MAEITYLEMVNRGSVPTAALQQVDWAAMKQTLIEDEFDNGRTPAQLESSFANSAVSIIAYAENQIIGTARALSDWVCNAYIVDVWTYTPYRNQGVARAMIERIMAHLRGQHVYLWTDDAMDFYPRLNFRKRGVGFERVTGEWLVTE